MYELEAMRLEKLYPGTRSVESAAKAMYYFLDDDRKGIAIAGFKGVTGLTIAQAKVLYRELPEILEMMGYNHECIHTEL